MVCVASIRYRLTLTSMSTLRDLLKPRTNSNTDVSIGKELMNKPSSHIGYSEDDLENVRKCCLYLATILGDFKDDIVIVGGLVPSLLKDHINPYAEPGSDSPLSAIPHTKDLDIGLALSILDEEKYTELSALLRSADFAPDENDDGRLTRQRWRIAEPHLVTVDFLIEPSGEADIGGNLRNIETDFAAIITPGLHLAFADRKEVVIKGYTLFDEYTEKNVWVCGPGAFIVLKALALGNRGLNKDAYDLSHMLNSTMFDGSSLEDIGSFLSVHREDPCVQDALCTLRQTFGRRDGIGPKRTARYLGYEDDEDVISDVHGLALRLLEEADRLM